LSYANPQALVETDWLIDNLDAPNVRVIDVSYFLPGVDRNPQEEFAAKHIPGAVYFDINDIADMDTDLPHMLPDAETFSDKVSALGIANTDKVVAYDSNGGGMAAARAWWMFRVFGHDDVALLNGGLPKWLAEDRPTTDKASSPTLAAFTAAKNETLVRDINQLLANIDSGTEQVVDARSKDRFVGKAPEPRKGAGGGHIPGSLNLPFVDFFDKDQNFVMRGAEELTNSITAAGIDLERPITTSCGSGVSAAMLALGFYLIGREDVAVYDGSWSEWGMRPDTPIDT